MLAIGPILSSRLRPESRGGGPVRSYNLAFTYPCQPPSRGVHVRGFGGALTLLTCHWLLTANAGSVQPPAYDCPAGPDAAGSGSPGVYGDERPLRGQGVFPYSPAHGLAVVPDPASGPVPKADR